jgi:zinc D-Ala-D-Ala carboxypeptidase
MNISKNFTMEEMTYTSTGIRNIPSVDQSRRIRLLVLRLLQPLRDAIGPLRVTSGFRSPLVNEAVGSTNPKSQHVRGEAADIKGIEVTNFEVASHIYNNLDFDQMILEFVEDEEPKWIHVSYKETGNRKQVLIAMKSKKKTEYILYSPKLSEKIYGKVL